MLTLKESAARQIRHGIVPIATKNLFMNDQSPCYLAFLLRLWCVAEEDGVVWRASLEDVHTGERKGFADVPHLFVFLSQQVSEVSRNAQSVLGETI